MKQYYNDCLTNYVAEKGFTLERCYEECANRNFFLSSHLDFIEAYHSSYLAFRPDFFGISVVFFDERLPASQFGSTQDRVVGISFKNGAHLRQIWSRLAIGRFYFWEIRTVFFDSIIDFSNVSGHQEEHHRLNTRTLLIAIHQFPDSRFSDLLIGMSQFFDSSVLYLTIDVLAVNLNETTQGSSLNSMQESFILDMRDYEISSLLNLQVHFKHFPNVIVTVLPPECLADAYVNPFVSCDVWWFSPRRCVVRH